MPKRRHQRQTSSRSIQTIQCRPARSSSPNRSESKCCVFWPSRRPLSSTGICSSSRKSIVLPTEPLKFRALRIIFIYVRLSKSKDSDRCCERLVAYVHAHCAEQQGDDRSPAARARSARVELPICSPAAASLVLAHVRRLQVPEEASGQAAANQLVI